MKHDFMKSYIVKINEDQYIGFNITFTSKNEPMIYRNTSIKSFEKVKEYLSLDKDSLDLETKNIPKFVKDWANVIASIQRGTDQDTSTFPVDYSNYTEKQKIVIEFCIQNIPVNEIWPYSKVAELSGLPKAQRFVGSTMKKSRHPFLLPVQRIKSLKYLKKSQKVSRKMPL